MTKDTNQENTLKVIRYIQENVEGLKERIDYISNHQALRSETQAYLISITEVQPNHLLLAMNKAYRDATKNTFYAGGDFSHCYCVCSDNTLVEKSSSLGKSPVIKTITVYDLTKTVQENLESNPEFTNYLINLFGL
jgi:hypothetical protein